MNKNELLKSQKNNNKFFECKICHSKVSLSFNKEKNKFYFSCHKSIVETYENIKNYLKINCINCDSEIIISYCQTCKNFYCRKCGFTHNNKYKDHNINNIKDEKIEEFPKIYSSKSHQYNFNDFNYNFDNKEEFEKEKHLTFYNDKTNKKFNNDKKENQNEFKTLNINESSRVKNPILEITCSEFTNSFCSSKKNNNTLINSETENIDFQVKKEIKKIKDSYFTKLNKETENLKIYFENLKRNKEKEFKNDYQKYIEKLKEDFKQKKNNVSNEEIFNKIKEDYEKDLKKEKEKIKEEYNKIKEKLKEEYKKEIEEIKKNYEIKLNEIKTENEKYKTLITEEEEKFNEKMNEIDEYEKEIGKLQIEINKKELEKEQLRKEINDEKLNNKKIKNKNELLKKKLDLKKKKIQNLENEIEKCKNKINYYESKIDEDDSEDFNEPKNNEINTKNNMINHYFQNKKNENEEENNDEKINIKKISIKKNEEKFQIGKKDETNILNSVRQPSIVKIIKECAQSGLNLHMPQKLKITSRKVNLMNKKNKV